MSNRPDVTENFDARSPSWGAIDRGTLKMNPAMANMNIEDILTEADLAFQPLLVQTHYYDPVDGKEHMSGAHSVIRADNGNELGTGFSDGYTPVGYLDALEGLFGDVKKLGGIPTRAINFKDGRRTALQFVLPDTWYIAERQHNLFFNVFAGHDGTTGILFNSADTCIVCGNTFAMAKASQVLRYSARHTSNVTARLAEIRQAIFTIQETSKAYYSVLQLAAQKPANEAIITEFVNFIHPDEKKEGVRDNRARANKRGDLNTAIAVSVAERNGSVPTIYDLFSGQTRMVSWNKQNRTAEEQFEYAMTNAKNQAAYTWIKEKI